jgi:hypothetical protein
MSESTQTPTHAEAQTKQDDKPKIHRVCTTCNNMFEVTMDKFEAKICPNCHKG